MRVHRIAIIAMGLLGTVACAPQSASPIATENPSISGGWTDVSATLDPATTPVYEGNAPLVFEFQLDMRKGDPLSLSKLSLGAHSGTHIDAPQHFIRAAELAHLLLS